MQCNSIQQLFTFRILAEEQKRKVIAQRDMKRQSRRDFVIQQTVLFQQFPSDYMKLSSSVAAAAAA